MTREDAERLLELLQALKDDTQPDDEHEDAIDLVLDLVSVVLK